MYIFILESNIRQSFMSISFVIYLQKLRNVLFYKISMTKNTLSDMCSFRFDDLDDSIFSKAFG